MAFALCASVSLCLCGKSQFIGIVSRFGIVKHHAAFAYAPARMAARGRCHNAIRSHSQDFHYEQIVTRPVGFARSHAADSG